MLKHTLMWFVCLFIGFAGTAVAQPADGALFIDAAAFANIGWYSHLSSNGIETPDISGTVAGGSVSIGTWLSPRFSARLELAAPADLSASSTTTSGPNVTLVTPTGTLLAPTITDTLRTSQHERTAAVLLAYHTSRRRRVQLAYLGGVVFVFLTQRQSDVTSASPSITGLPHEDEATFRAYGASAEVGMDADVALGRHLSLVPQVRIVADGISVRPGVALRAHW